MPATTLSDVKFQSEIFAGVLDGEFTHRLALLSSGLVTEAPEQFVSSQMKGQFGSLVKPKALSDSSQQIVSGGSLTLKSNQDFKDTFVWVEREQAWGAEQIIRVIAGRDKTKEIAQMIGQWLAKEIHDLAINVLKGAFTVELASTHSTGATYTTSTIDFEPISKAKQLLGDNLDMLSLIVMHSKVWTDAVNKKLTALTPLGDNITVTGAIPMILGLRPSMTDQLTPVSDIYSTYIASPGAMIYKLRKRDAHAFNNERIITYPNNVEVELYRDSLTSGGVDGLIVRYSAMAHLPGVSYKMATAPANPTNTQLATGSNWEKVANDDKLIKIVEIKTL